MHKGSAQDSAARHGTGQDAQRKCAEQCCKLRADVHWHALRDWSRTSEIESRGLPVCIQTAKDRTNKHQTRGPHDIVKEDLRQPEPRAMVCMDRLIKEQWAPQPRAAGVLRQAGRRPMRAGAEGHSNA